MKTFLQDPKERKLEWRLVDADGQVLGRLATHIATMLRGKHKPIYTPHLDLGDGVIVINAEKVRVTGRKADLKIVYRHSGFPGGLKSARLGDLLRTKPEQVITDAVRGMLPQTPLGRQMIKKLRVYRGTEHPHKAQKPANQK
ncbi:MAG: 50S ribosomal protein L13 [Acidimicrobiia bacterium]